MIFNKLETLEIKARFKFYPNVVCGVDRKLYQLTHFKNRKTIYFHELKYNVKRNSYCINSQNVSKNRMLDKNNIILKREIINI